MATKNKRYHLSKDGLARPCSAPEGSCPLGTEVPHTELSDSQSAQRWAEGVLEAQYQREILEDAAKEFLAMSRSSRELNFATANEFSVFIPIAEQRGALVNHFTGNQSAFEAASSSIEQKIGANEEPAEASEAEVLMAGWQLAESLVSETSGSGHEVYDVEGPYEKSGKDGTVIGWEVRVTSDSQEDPLF